MTEHNERRDNGSVQALRRVTAKLGGAALLEQLADELSGTDLTTLLLEVFRRRALRLRPAEVLSRYRTDRFVAPGTVDAAALRHAEGAMLAALPAQFDVLTLAPVLPLGSHTATGHVDPRNVIATIRGSEVAADPTNGLALEAAARRSELLHSDPRSAGQVRLAASQRVTRAQLFGGPVSFAHFQLLGAVTAGRDTGSHAFESEHLAEHIGIGAAGLAALGLGRVTVAVTCLDDAAPRILAAVREQLDALPNIEVTEAPERESGRAYYRCLCFKVFARRGNVDADQPGMEVADGGFTNWTAELLGNRKERLLISGYGLDRVAVLAADATTGRGS